MVKNRPKRLMLVKATDSKGRIVEIAAYEDDKGNIDTFTRRTGKAAISHLKEKP